MPKARFETRGAVMLGGSAVMALAGLLTVDGVLIAMGTGGAALLGLGWLLGAMNLRRLGIDLELAETLRAEVPARMRIGVANRRRFIDGFGLGLTVEGPGGLFADCRVPWVPAGSSAESELRVSVPLRGRGKELTVSVHSVFPLGWFRHEWSGSVPRDLLVLPHPVVPGEIRALGASVETEASRATGPGVASGEPRGLRGFRSGDPAKSTAWAASLRSMARGGGLMVREVDPPGLRPKDVAVVFHSFASDRALIRPDRFERALSLLWGTVRQLHAAGVPVVVTADFDEWIPRHVESARELGRLGEMLAGAVRAGGTEAHELAGRIEDLRGTVVVISDMPADTWRKWAGPGTVVVDVADLEKRKTGGRSRA